MSLTDLSKRVSSFRQKVRNHIDETLREIDEAEDALGAGDPKNHRVKEGGVDEKENTFRVRQSDPGNYNRFITKKITSGVKAVIGFKKGGGSEVQSYIFEKAKFDEERARKWVKDHGGKITESAKNIDPTKVDLDENAPVGSFEYLSTILRDALDKVNLFPSMIGRPWLMYTYPEKILVGIDSKYFEIPYQITVDGVTVFGKPVEVEQYYAPKEVSEADKKKIKEAKTLDAELTEANITRTKEAVDMDINIADFVSLKESKFNEETGEVEVVLIEAGTNPAKKRHYPSSTIQEAAPMFRGLKMYLNHPTAKEEMERPERDITQWASTIVESWYDNGMAKGRVAVHDSWLRERLKDSVAREHIGVSINAGGKVSYGKINGEEMQIVEKILFARKNGPVSVDWVTEAGARGRVSRLLKESSTTKENKSMEIKEATFADLQRENPKVVEEITAPLQKQLKEANDKISAIEKENKINAQKAKVSAWLKESKSLPEPAKERVASEMLRESFDSEEKLKEAFDAKVKSELDYLNKFSGKGKIRMGANSDGHDNNGTSIKESAQMDLEKRMGLDKPSDKKDKKDKDED
ncbi:MAG: capsid maturation protease [Siphoviridae sp. ctCJE6]|nr:MAG: capsid maturation protease [Siphoviridae sp. ctCJE6]